MARGKVFKNQPTVAVKVPVTFRPFVEHLVRWLDHCDQPHREIKKLSVLTDYQSERENNEEST